MRHHFNDNFNRQSNSMDKEFASVRRLAVAGFLFSCAVTLGILGGTCYIVWHFLQRVW